MNIEPFGVGTTKTVVAGTSSPAFQVQDAGVTLAIVTGGDTLVLEGTADSYNNVAQDTAVWQPLFTVEISATDAATPFLATTTRALFLRVTATADADCTLTSSTGSASQWFTQTSAQVVQVGNNPVTLTETQLAAGVILLNAPAPHAGRTEIVFPQRVGLYAIDNVTGVAGNDGGNVSFVTAAGTNTPLDVDAGNAGWYWCNGVDLFALSVPPTSFGAITCTSLDAGSGTIQTTGIIQSTGSAVMDSNGFTGAIGQGSLFNGAFQGLSSSDDTILCSAGPTKLLGFYGATGVVQPAAPVTLGDVIAALQALGLVAT